MYALIRQGNGKYYESTVFGTYFGMRWLGENKDYPRYEKARYYIVLNPQRTGLVKQFLFREGTVYFDQMVLIVDSDETGYVFDKDYCGCVDFLSKERIDDILESGTTPPDILRKCLELDGSFQYDPFPEIKNEKDIENLTDAVRSFHDARIKEMGVLDDGTLHVILDELWGCNLEIWFWGDVDYCKINMEDDDVDQFWLCGSVRIQDGFIFLVDDISWEPVDLDDRYCWFKARHMRYHIIPD